MLLLLDSGNLKVVTHTDGRSCLIKAQKYPATYSNSAVYTMCTRHVHKYRNDGMLQKLLVKSISRGEENKIRDKLCCASIIKVALISVNISVLRESNVVRFL